MKIYGKLGVLPCIPCWQMLLLLLTGEVVIESSSWCCGLHVFRRTRSLLVICVWFGECSMTDGHVCVSKLAPAVRCCSYCSPAFPFHFCFPLASFHIQLFSVPGIILLMSTKVCRCGATLHSPHMALLRTIWSSGAVGCVYLFEMITFEPNDFRPRCLAWWFFTLIYLLEGHVQWWKSVVEVRCHRWKMFLLG